MGLSWSPVKRRRSRGRPSRQQLWEDALQEHILHHHEPPRGVRLQRLDWWQQGSAIARSLTHEEIAHTSAHCAPSPPPTPAAALVEDEPSSSAAKRRKVQVDPFVPPRHVLPLEDRRAMGHTAVGEVPRLCPGLFDGINPNIPYRWKRSAPRAAPLGRKSLTRRHDTAGQTSCASAR